MRYLCLCYRDEAALAALSRGAHRAFAEETTEQHEELRRRGFHLASLALHPGCAATIVRVRGGRLDIADGDCAEARETLGALVLIAARDLNEAIRLAATLPTARLGHIEIRPVAECIGD